MKHWRAGNLFLGNEMGPLRPADTDKMICAASVCGAGKTDIDPLPRLAIGLGQRQLVEIAKALNKQVRLLVLDEPTASLTESETAVLLDIIRDLRHHDIACIYISHKLTEVKAISDKLCVIRDGRHIATCNAAGTSEKEIISMMVGRELTELFPPRDRQIGDEILRVENLTAWHPVNRHIRRVDNAGFTLRQGEVLGVAGLVGAGRTEMMECLFGVYPGKWSGDIWLQATSAV